MENKKELKKKWSKYFKDQYKKNFKFSLILPLISCLLLFILENITGYNYLSVIPLTLVQTFLINIILIKVYKYPIEFKPFVEKNFLIILIFNIVFLLIGIVFPIIFQKKF